MYMQEMSLGYKCHSGKIICLSKARIANFPYVFAKHTETFFVVDKCIKSKKDIDLWKSVNWFFINVLVSLIQGWYVIAFSLWANGGRVIWGMGERVRHIPSSAAHSYHYENAYKWTHIFVNLSLVF